MGNKIVYIVIITFLLFHPNFVKANADVIQDFIAQADLAKINSSDSLAFFLNETEKLISDETPPHLKLRFLTDKGDFLKSKQSFQQAISYYQKALAEPNISEQDALLAEIYKNLGMCYHGLGKIKEAHLWFNKSETLFVAQNNQRDLAEILYQKSLLYKQFGEYALANKTIDQTLNLLEEWTNNELKANCYLALGEIKMLCCTKVQEASDFYQMAIDLLVVDGPSKLLASAYRLMATSKQPKEAFLFYNKAKDVLKQLGTNDDINVAAETALNQYHLAGNYMERKHFREALNEFDLAYKLFNKIGNIEYLAKSLSQKGAAYYALDEYAIGLPFLIDAHKIAIDHANHAAIETTAYNLYEAYESIEDLGNALKYYKAYQTNKDALLEQTKNAGLLLEDVGFEDNQNANSALASAQTQKNELVVFDQVGNRFKSFKNSFLLIFCILFISLGAIYMLYRKQNQTNILLNLSNDDLKKKNEIISSKNLEIEKKYKENRTLLLEIHHRVKNNLQAISSLLSLQANYLTDEQALSAILGSQTRVQSVALIHQKLYQRQNLYSLDIKDFIDSLLVNLANLFNVNEDATKLIFSGESLYFKLDTAIPLTLIINELMTNTFKYAFPNKQSGLIEVSLVEIDNKIILKYADNGIGLERKEMGTGFGSKLIDLLCKQLQGTCNIKESQTGLAYEFEFLSYELDLQRLSPLQKKEFVEM